MNTFHRFFVAGLLTSLSLICVSTAEADQMSGQQSYQQQSYSQPQLQPPSQERNYGQNVGNKALNGVINIHTAVLEIPKAMINDINAPGSNIVFGIIGGALEGSLNTAFRAATGVIDLATFLIPTKAIVHPQYVWDDFYEGPTSYDNVFRLDNTAKPSHFELPGQAKNQGIARQSSKAPSTMY